MERSILFGPLSCTIYKDQRTGKVKGIFGERHEESFENIAEQCPGADTTILDFVNQRANAVLLIEGHWDITDHRSWTKGDDIIEPKSMMLAELRKSGQTLNVDLRDDSLSLQRLFTEDLAVNNPTVVSIVKNLTTSGWISLCRKMCGLEPGYVDALIQLSSSPEWQTKLALALRKSSIVYRRTDDPSTSEKVGYIVRDAMVKCSEPMVSVVLNERIKKKVGSKDLKTLRSLEDNIFPILLDAYLLPTMFDLEEQYVFTYTGDNHARVYSKVLAEAQLVDSTSGRTVPRYTEKYKSVPSLKDRDQTSSCVAVPLKVLED